MSGNPSISYLDSLYSGYPVGYLITWRNPTVRLKDGTYSAGNRTQGLREYVQTIISSELPASFWTGMLPQLMDTSSASSLYFQAYRAAQAKLGDKGFLSRDITVRDLLLNRAHVHHLFPKDMLKKQDLQRGRYNQIANFVVAQSEINITIGDETPTNVFAHLRAQVSGGDVRYGGITDPEMLHNNLTQNCIPEALLKGVAISYDEFLIERRKRSGSESGSKAWVNNSKARNQ